MEDYIETKKMVLQAIRVLSAKAANAEDAIQAVNFSAAAAKLVELLPNVKNVSGE